MPNVTIDETVTYQELSKKVELIKVGPNYYDFELTPYALFGARIDDLDIEFVTISFTETGNIDPVMVFLNAQNDFKVVLDRFKNTFSKCVRIDAVGEERYMLSDNKKSTSIFKADDSFSIIINLVNNKGCSPD